VDADQLLSDYVGIMDIERTSDGRAYVGKYKSKFPSGATGTIHELVEDGTLVPQTARHLQIQKQAHRIAKQL